MIGELLAAAAGTVAFALLFGVPEKYYVYCGLIGASGWLLYEVLLTRAGAGTTEATFLATVLVVLLSRFVAVSKRCPATVFLISGIFPLVPGAGICWASYYLVTNQLEAALSSGFTAFKAMFAIVLGIVLVFELPYDFFRIMRRK
ncbi:MAG: threonine/serine exporter family protein [Lachnospiraceae bacterium]